MQEPTRRAALAAALTAPLAAAAPAASPRPRKRVYRLERNRWVRRRMSEFAPGEYMMYVNADDPPVYVKVIGRPAFDAAAGEWGCMVLDITPDRIPGHLAPGA